MSSNRQKLILALEDGRPFFGYAVGPGNAGRPAAEGELVFCTAMTGYQEVCSDPSYRGQIVVLTYPLIDNYGINAADLESTRPWLEALIVRDYCRQPRNWRANGQLATWLADYGIPVCEGFDTRALTRHLRTFGAKRAVIAPPRADALPAENDDAGAWLHGRVPGTDAEVARLVEQAKRVIPLEEQALVAEVSKPEYERLDASVWAPFAEPRHAAKPYRVVLIDCGVKHNIPRSLIRRGLETIIVPYDATLEDIEALRPDGVVLGNGPGDPGGDPSLRSTIETVRRLIEGPVKQRGLPLTAVCLGHQVLGLAIGGRTSRLKFGHRGANHPVKDLRSGRVYITSQNHGFQVDADSIPPQSGFVVSHVSLNDGSVEGLTHRELPVFTVQYHPEASPGPQDNQYLFDRFVDCLEERNRG
ncbi:MAG: glutamine-hydrolyzing carbamoyl-phosphate synthase small subunit [Chloroflexi bacterium]|nr:glutamine-hydrolyzing carbamoyl-phosphate synthase small subunit [Chloroflexota bacterium]